MELNKGAAIINLTLSEHNWVMMPSAEHNFVSAESDDFVSAVSDVNWQLLLIFLGFYIIGWQDSIMPSAEVDCVSALSAVGLSFAADIVDFHIID